MHLETGEQGFHQLLIVGQKAGIILCRRQVHQLQLVILQQMHSDGRRPCSHNSCQRVLRLLHGSLQQNADLQRVGGRSTQHSTQPQERHCCMSSHITLLSKEGAAHQLSCKVLP